MQHKIDSKHKLPQYNSIKDYQSSKESTHKISTKPPQQKSTQNQKLTKANPHSSSKSKLNLRPQKHNQNFNSINLPENTHKNKNNHHESQQVKRQTRRQQKLTRNSSERLIKSKSAIRLAPKTQRNRMSQSPIMRNEQPKQEQKFKAAKNTLSKFEKDKKTIAKNKQCLKRSSSMAVYQINQTKRQNTERTNANRVSIKTEGSSKMNSVIKEDQRHKKSKKSTKPSLIKKQGQQKQKQKNIVNKKDQKTKLQNKIKKSILYSQVSFQQFCQQNPCESAIVLNQKHYFPEGYTKVKTEGCQVSQLQYRISQKINTGLQVAAATKIQKVFRGYITRKYIQQAKIIITKIKTIQKWWRKMLLKRKQKPNKPSVENSLITIKDFNETMKSDRHKLFSQSKQNTLSNRKLNIKEIFKNILEENENQSQKSLITSLKKLKDDSLSPIQNHITKQVYIQHKIQAQINSQKVFNSPKLVISPRNIQTPTSMVSIKEFFNSSNQKQKVKQMLQSPKMKSPQPPKSTPKSTLKQQTQKFEIYKELATYIQPFETNFQAIEEISLILVDFFRDRPGEMTSFLNRIKQLSYFRTQLILKNWKQYKLLSESYYNQMEDSILPADYEFMQLFQKPSIFPQKLRQDILKFPSVQIDLNNKNYNLQDETNQPIHRCYLYFVFDVLQQAFYQSYKNCVLEWKYSINLRLYDSQKNLFQLAFSDALGFLCKWGQIMCGFMVNQPQDFVQQRQQRMKLMDKQIQPWDLGKGNKLGLKIQISEKIEEELWEEILNQLIQIFL